MRQITLVFIGIVLITVFSSCNKNDPKPNGALTALQYFAAQRTYPFKELPAEAYYTAFDYYRQEFVNNNLRTKEMSSPWEPLGPWNTAGRMLCIDIHTDEPNTIWAGSASGGLWKSDVFGKDTSWYRVETGWPVNGVAALALNPENKNEIIIGTGEVYNYERSGDGAAYRSTRGTPGIGILKSEDGGVSWKIVLDWTRDQNNGVHQLAFAPTASGTVYAATTEGVFRSVDTGSTWVNTLEVPMCTDVVISPFNSDHVIVGCGNFNTPEKGIYYSRDGGESWSLATGDIPDFNGKIRIDVSKNKPGIAYASIGDGFSTSAPTATWTLKTLDGGETWEEVSTVDYSRWQGWFAHDIAVHPTSPDTIIGVGIYIHKSEKSGDQFEQITRNPQVTSGRPPVGGPDGPLHYTHVDHHYVMYHPVNTDTVLVACDGGIFYSWNGGEDWESRTGGLQTTQFYNGISISPFREDWILGGLQDNNSVHYDGDKAWTRILGGDGGWSAIDPFNENTFFASYQWMNLFKSTSAGRNFQRTININNDDNPAFIAPFVMHPEQSNVLYAGTNKVYRTEDQGESWVIVNGGRPINGNNPILSMQVAPSDVRVLYVGTAPFDSASSVWVTQDAGDQWTQVGAGVLPDRYPVDFDVDPTDPARAIVVYGGYLTGHVFITEDYGQTWEDITSNLPDMPTNAVTIDAERGGVIYVGNDIGVFFSEDEGQTWQAMNTGLPEPVVVSDLKLSVITKKLVVGTHGNGIYMTDLIDPATTADKDAYSEIGALSVFPNPIAAGRSITIGTPGMTGLTSYQIIDQNGRTVLSGNLEMEDAHGEIQMNVSPGVYYITLSNDEDETRKSSQIIVQ